jgi:cytochrome c-type biogenesis protein CcmH
MTASLLALGALALLAALVICLPLARRGQPHSARAAELAIQRDRLAELDRDVVRGLIDAREAAAARTEIERHLLKLARRPDAAPVERRASRLVVLACAVLAPLGAGLLYWALGAPGLPDMPLAGRSLEGGAGQEAEILAMVEGLEARLAADPDDAQGWLMLGRSRLVLGDALAAVTAYREALARAPESGEARAALGEALIIAAGGVVTPEARELFAAVGAEDPRGGFYLGLADLQAGNADAAIERWRMLLARSPADAPWRPRVEAGLREAAAELGIDPEAILADLPAAEQPEGPSPESAAAVAGLPPEQQAEAVRGMVEGLEARLEQEGGDAEAWRRLGRARLVLGEVEAARAAYAEALEQAPEEPMILIEYAEALLGPPDPRTRLPEVGQEAGALFEQAARLAPQAPSPHWYLGIRALQAGELDQARERWEQVLKLLGPEHPDYAGVKSILDAIALRETERGGEG